MEEHEEGEVTDSESDTEQSAMLGGNAPVQPSTSSASPTRSAVGPAQSVHASTAHCRTSTSYRPMAKQDYSDDSDSSSFSDEDTVLWRCKKAKYFQSSKREESMLTELPEQIKSPPRNSVGKAIQASDAVKRRINNVWGSVLTEQSLTQNMKEVGVYKNPELLHSDRAVEKYDFTNAYDDDRPDAINIVPPESTDPFENVITSGLEEEPYRQGLKRKRKVKDRVGWKEKDGKKNNLKHRIGNQVTVITPEELDNLSISVENTEEEIVDVLGRELSEPKTELIAKIVRVVGKEKALQAFYEVVRIEDTGGMLTNDGYRRRSPGGVYFTLIKTDKSLSTEQHKEIFDEEDRNFKEQLKKEKKLRRQMARQKRRMFKKLPQSKLLNSKNDDKTAMKIDRTATDSDSDENEHDSMDGATEDVMKVKLNSSNSDAVVDMESGDVIDLGLGDGEII